MRIIHEAEVLYLITLYERKSLSYESYYVEPPTLV